MTGQGGPLRMSLADRREIRTMKLSDISKAEWDRLIEAIKRPDHSFDLNDLTRAVMAKFDMDERTAKRLVRRQAQQMTIKPRDVARLWQGLV